MSYKLFPSYKFRNLTLTLNVPFGSNSSQIQADGGLDVIIVDKVKLISTTLSGNYPP